ncbi:GNAT family N-acetyltransferase [Alkalimonas sp.]|uniref:GNAT family N-acetyltransferase n=1 Tax=Alkalimonas sp. TaxID=1872453 RepID=UPI00263A55BE|nr:GNAT family N-acetyltransferase [Alkalimonas sp.]MCC5826255.1 N-acetyltransferase [Alkalimonas sp.]
MNMRYAIEHQPELQRFRIVQQGEEALLEYQLLGDSVDFWRTFVPDALRGQGMAEQLVRHGLAWAEQKQLAVQASCWYVQKFL